MNFDFPLFLVIATVVTGLIWLIDALFFAASRRSRSLNPNGPKDPVLVEYSKSFFPVILAVLVLRSFVVEPFRIPSGSMMPTLLVGDFILVNKFTYGIRLPVVNRKIVDINDPERGDVVVFKYPVVEKGKQPHIDYIKRVVGVPGDQVDYKDKTLYVNGEKQPQTPLGVYRGVGTGTRESGSLKLLETLNSVEHEMLVNPWSPDFAGGCQVLARGPITVPAGHYFVMGDNRDNSNDSRCWGLVPEQNLVGKAFGIWMSWDSNRDDFPVAWERIGNGIK